MKEAIWRQKQTRTGGEVWEGEGFGGPCREPACHAQSPWPPEPVPWGISWLLVESRYNRVQTYPQEETHTLAFLSAHGLGGKLVLWI